MCSGYTVRSRSGSPVPCGYVCDETIGRCAFELSTNRFAVTTDRALVSLDVLLTRTNRVYQCTNRGCYFPFAARAAVRRVRARLGLALFGALRLRTRAHPTTVIALRSTSASRPCARGIPRAAALVNINIGFSPLCSGYTARSQSGSPVPCGYVCDKTLGRCAFKLSTNRVAVTTDRALVNLDVLLTRSNNVLTRVATSPMRRVPLCGACVRV